MSAKGAKPLDQLETGLSGRDRHEKLLSVEAMGILRNPDYADLLVDHLGSPEPEVAETILDTLGRIGNPRSAKYILPFLNSESPVLVERALQALAHFEIKPLVESLLKVAGPERPTPIRRRLLALLGGCKDPRVASLMHEVLNQGQEPALLVEAIGHFIRFPSPDKHPLLKAFTGNAQWEIALSAHLALSRLNDEGARQQLKRLAKSPAHPIRMAIVLGLNRAPMIQDRDLYEVFLRDIHPQIRHASLKGLNLFNAAERCALLLDLLGKEREEWLRNHLLELAIHEKAPVLYGEFVKLVGSSQEDHRDLGRRGLVAMDGAIVERLLNDFSKLILTVKEQVLLVLGEIADTRALSLFNTCLDSRERWLRLNAIEGLARMKHQGSVPRLIEILRKEKDVWIIATLLSALGRLVESTQIPIFIDFLRHPDARVRANAVECVAKLGGVVAKKALEDHLRDPNDRVRVNAAIALWHMGEKSVLDTLLRMTGEPPKWVRASAAFALGEMGDHEATPTLLKLLADKEDVVYKNALEALGKLGDRRALLPLLRERKTGRLPKEEIARALQRFSGTAEK